MDESLITVTNCENPPINLEITAYKEEIDITFNASIDSILSVHESNLQAHSTIIEPILSDIIDISASLEDTIAMQNTLSSDINSELLNKLDVSDATVTKQGNTFNGAGQLVKLNASGQLPQLNASLLTDFVSGVLPLNAIGSISDNFTLVANKITTANLISGLGLSLPTTGLISDVENICILDFSTTSISTPTLPTDLKWSNRNNGKAPTSYSTISGIRNVLIFRTRDLGVTWEAEYETYGGVETTWVQQVLTSNGTIGSTISMAVAVLSGGENQPIFWGFDSSSSSYAQCQSSSGSFVMSFPVALKILSLGFVTSSSWQMNSATIYGSNDNTIWTTINSTTSSAVNWTWDLSVNTNFYKYYKIIWGSTGGYGLIIYNCVIGAKYIAA